MDILITHIQVIWDSPKSFIPDSKYGGRPRSTNIRDTMNAIFYVARTGCQWRMLPLHFPPWQTVYRYFRTWKKTGVIRKLQRFLYVKVRKSEGRTPTPSLICIDSQSVKTGKAGGDRGYDGGKRVKGRKRHLIVDTLEPDLKVIE